MNNKMKTLTYKGKKFQVQRDGTIWYEGRILPQFLNKRTGYMTTTIWDKELKKYIHISIHRIVLMAWRPRKNMNNLQCDHIDGVRTNNHISNLRWVTRLQNNRRKHARMMKSINNKKMIRSDQFIKSVDRKTGEIRYYKNGPAAAMELSCSTPFVYMALEGNTPYCKGKVLTWVPREECPELVEKVEATKKKRSDKFWRARKAVMKNLPLSERRKWRVVQQIDEATGEVIAEWSNVHQAQQETGIWDIGRMVRSGENGEVKNGVRWRYKIPSSIADEFGLEYADEVED